LNFKKFLIFPALRRLKQENFKFEASLGYIGRPGLSIYLERKRKKEIYFSLRCATHCNVSSI
jgi:hypothetical protein